MVKTFKYLAMSLTAGAVVYLLYRNTVACEAMAEFMKQAYD